VSVEKAPWWYDEAMLEFGPVLGIIWMVVGSFVAASAVLEKVHEALYMFGGLSFVVAGMALQFLNRANKDDREFFGGR
jgi:membrane-associated phospholipid phosphatase